MAESYPYISGAGNLTQMVNQLRKAFPDKVTSESVKKLGLAPNNEAYVINALRFIGLIDKDGKKSANAKEIFSHHRDEEFANAFSKLIEKSYEALFELRGDDAWKLGKDDLITFFRRSDQTSDAIGRRQASVFEAFSAISGKGKEPVQKPGKTQKVKVAKKATSKKQANPKRKADDVVVVTGDTDSFAKNIGLTVRVEINLPAQGTKDTYDQIFRSIKENLLDA